MADPPPSQMERSPLRSLNSQEKCKIIFMNRSRRRVEIIWLNYTGEETKYFDLNPSSLYIIDSYVTHPWLVRDSRGRNIVPVNGYLIPKDNFLDVARRRVDPSMPLAVSSSIFYPSAHTEQELLLVIMKDRLPTLREICFQLMCDQNMAGAEILKTLPSIIAEDYSGYRSGDLWLFKEETWNKGTNLL